MQFVDGLLGHDSDVIYNYHGHRCKELIDVNLRNYILFVGDNAGLVLDKPIEETLPYITAKRLSVDYYNLCIFNGGIDAIRYNLFSWINNYPKPKAIIIASEFANSLLVSDKNHSFISVADLSDPMVTDAINSANVNGFFNGRLMLFNNLVSTCIQTPIFQLNIKDKIKLLQENTIDIDYDPKNPMPTVDLLVEGINKIYKSARASV